jgi:hypothetical protein
MIGVQMGMEPMEIRLLMMAFDEALKLLPRVAWESSLPDDYEQLARKILLVLLKPNEKHGFGEALSGYDEEGHRVFIAFYCPVDKVPHPSAVTFAFVHELAHIFLELNEEEVEPISLRAGRELGLDIERSEERNRVYEEKKHVWNEGLFPYLGVLKGEVGPEEAKEKIRDMTERGFDFSV